MSAKNYIWLIFLSISSTSFAGIMDEIDSLENKLPQLQGIDEINALLSLSEMYRTVSFNDCMKFGLRSAQLANEKQEFDLEALAYKSLGNSCYIHAELDMANEYYRKGLAGYKKTNNIQGQSNCLNNIGLVFKETLNLDSAEYYYVQSLDIEKQLNNQIGQAISLLQLGNLSYYRDELQSALDNYYQAMLIFREKNDSTNLALSYNSLGIIYREWNLFDKALEYFGLAIPILANTGDDRSLSQVLNNLGEIYNFELKDYKKAQELYEKSLRIKQKMNDKIGIALLNNNIGTLYANMEDAPMALHYFEISKKLYEEFNGETGIVMVLYNIGSLYLVTHQYDKAIENLLSSLKLAEEFNYVEFISLSQESLMHCYAALGKYDLYQNYFRLYSLNSDSLVDKLYVLQSKETEIKYRIEETLEESKRLQESNKLKETEIRKYKLILAGISALVILLIMVYVLFIKLKKQP
ncbi:MAG: tetratricopeptide repeat protein [Bacteroidales bacterium]|nr:tetratricopeptide repeat protein [Bacteroidales bacterium]